MRCSQPPTNSEKKVVVLCSDAPRIPSIFEPVLCCQGPFLRYPRQELRVRISRAVHTLDRCGNDFEISQHFRHGRQEERRVPSLPAVKNLLNNLHGEVFQTRTTIRNQNFAHRPRNVDSRGSVAISKVHKHLFQIREQPSNVFTTEDAIRKTIKNEALASQLMHCVETAQEIAD